MVARCCHLQTPGPLQCTHTVNQACHMLDSQSWQLALPAMLTTVSTRIQFATDKHRPPALGLLLRGVAHTALWRSTRLRRRPAADLHLQAGCRASHLALSCLDGTLLYPLVAGTPSPLACTTPLALEPNTDGSICSCYAMETEMLPGHQEWPDFVVVFL